MEQWEKTLPVKRDEEPGRMTWRDKEGRLVVCPDDTLKRRILREYHDHWGAGHPGHDETIRKVQNNYFWPLQRIWIDHYIKGCTTCQQNKNLTHVTKTPLYKITMPEIVIGTGMGNPTGCRVGYSQVEVRVGFSPPRHYPHPKPRYRRVFFFLYYKSVQIRNCNSFKES
jgi:hypothetical protein